MDLQSHWQLEHPIPGARASRLGVLLLVALTAIWGSTFSVMKGVIDRLPPANLMLWRFAIASVILLPFVRKGWRLWLAAMEMGLWLWIGYATQLIGLQYTTTNRSAFITSLSVIFVPIIAAIAGRKISITIWIAATIAMIGAGFLSYDSTKPNIGDLWTLATAIGYGMFIYRLEWAASKFEPLPLTAISMIVVTLLSLMWLGVRHETVVAIPWKQVLYLGVVATALTTTLQTFGQRRVPAPQVGVIYTLEPVFGALFSFLLRGELLGGRGWIGAALIVFAALLCQMPSTAAEVLSEPIKASREG